MVGINGTRVPPSFPLAGGCLVPKVQSEEFNSSYDHLDVNTPLLTDDSLTCQKYLTMLNSPLFRFPQLLHPNILSFSQKSRILRFNTSSGHD
uniref:Uncharacterized protein n=1 Tax=Arundo donax TaxID=35708 RepID=A0A0A9HDI7_ARUDO